jgi:hypothetical protein
MVSRSGSRPPRVSIQRVTGGRSRSARSAASRSRSRSPRAAVRYWPRKVSAQASGSCRGSTGCGIGEIAVLAEDGARSLDVGPRSGRLVLCAISGSSVGRAGDACLSSQASAVGASVHTPPSMGKRHSALVGRTPRGSWNRTMRQRRANAPWCGRGRAKPGPSPIHLFVEANLAAFYPSCACGRGRCLRPRPGIGP